MDNGELLIVTDDLPYFDWMQSQLPRTGFEAHPEIIPPRFSTKYERKWQELGQNQFYQLRLIKRRHIEIPVKEDVSLRTYHVEHFDPEHFNLSRARGKIIVEFKEVLYDQVQQKGMVRSVVEEDNFVQNFWIELVKREKGWIIQPAKGCGIISTSGVQRALDLVRDATEK